MRRVLRLPPFASACKTVQIRCMISKFSFGNCGEFRSDSDIGDRHFESADISIDGGRNLIHRIVKPGLSPGILRSVKIHRPDSQHIGCVLGNAIIAFRNIIQLGMAEENSVKNGPEHIPVWTSVFVGKVQFRDVSIALPVQPFLVT